MVLFNALLLAFLFPKKIIINAWSGLSLIIFVLHLIILFQE